MSIVANIKCLIVKLTPNYIVGLYSLFKDKRYRKLSFFNKISTPPHM